MIGKIAVGEISPSAVKEKGSRRLKAALRLFAWFAREYLLLKAFFEAV